MSAKLTYSVLLPKKRKRLIKRELQKDEMAPVIPDRKKKKRLGRGISAGQGKTCGRGENGQKSRTGYSYRKGFEGGQTPIYRRLPKRGFYNPNSKTYQLINLQAIEKSQLKGKLEPNLFKDKGLISKPLELIKILGTGNVSGPVELIADAFSKSAREKLEASGCKCVVRDRKAGKKNLDSKKGNKKDTEK